MARKGKQLETVDEVSNLRALRLQAVDLLRRNHVIVDNEDFNLQVIPTGFSSFDHDVLNIGGIPLGYLTQIFGPESSGKTTLALRIAAMAQRTFPEKLVYWADTEFTLTMDRARQHGINTDQDAFVVNKNNIAEEVFDQIIRAAASGAVSVIVIDSIGNLMSLKSANMEYWETKDGKRQYTPQPGEMANKITAFVQQLTYWAAKNKVAVIGINQIRSKIGVLYGDPTDVPGGHAWKHDLTIDMRARRVEYDDESVTVAIFVKKNKLFGPSGTTDANHLVFYFENGIEQGKIYNVFDMAVRRNIIRPQKSWIKWYDEQGELIKTVQGKANFMKLMRDAEVLEQLEEQINATPPTSEGIPEETIPDNEVPDLPEREESTVS